MFTILYCTNTCWRRTGSWCPRCTSRYYWLMRLFPFESYISSFLWDFLLVQYHQFWNDARIFFSFNCIPVEILVDICMYLAMLISNDCHNHQKRQWDWNPFVGLEVCPRRPSFGVTLGSKRKPRTKTVSTYYWIQTHLDLIVAHVELFQCRNMLNPLSGSDPVSPQIQFF